jgi:hypothetical protein
MFGFLIITTDIQPTHVPYEHGNKQVKKNSLWLYLDFHNITIENPDFNQTIVKKGSQYASPPYNQPVKNMTVY